MLMDLLQSICRLVVSIKKFQVLTNSACTDKEVRRSRILGPALHAHARNLGVDYTCGRRRLTTVNANRVKKMLKRMPFFRRLRAAGAKTARLARTGINPSLLYGAKVTGTSSSQLLRIRRMVRSSFQLSVAGRSLTLDLFLEGRGTDPAERAVCEPIITRMVRSALGFMVAPRLAATDARRRHYPGPRAAEPLDVGARPCVGAGSHSLENRMGVQECSGVENPSRRRQHRADAAEGSGDVGGKSSRALAMVRGGEEVGGFDQCGHTGDPIFFISMPLHASEALR